MPQKTIKLTIEYAGTNYCGWQIQPNGLAIQEVLEKRLKKITGREVRVLGSGRTDAGVHAEEQVAHFRTETEMDAKTFQRALNSLLPKDIVIKNAMEESREFHAQYSQKGKRYRYTILNRLYSSAFRHPYAWFFPYDLDVQKIKEATVYLVGRRDFAAFQASKSYVKTTVRNLTMVDVVSRGEDIVFFFEGEGFLKHMVRIMVGTLVDFGFRKGEPEVMKQILESRDRKKAGRTAPACGLCLEKVYY